MPAAKPVSVNEVAALTVSVTNVPAVGDAGGVAPVARRIITPVKSAAVGFTHDNVTDDAVTLEDTPDTGPGGVVSGDGGAV